MASFLIPNMYMAGFETLLQLDKTTIDKIGNQMISFLPGKGPKAFYEHMAVLDIKGIDEISKTIYSFSNLLIEQKSSHQEIAEGLLEAYKKRNPDSKIDLEKGKEMLLLIFSNSKSVKLSYKGLSLILDVPNAYAKSSIITDIRPVFNDELEDKDRYAIISQTIKIEYQNDGLDKTFYINFDSLDLEELKSQIERAQKKESILRKEYAEAFNFIKVQE